MKHRRTHSAPPGTYVRSPKLAPRHRTIDEVKGQESEGDMSTKINLETTPKLLDSDNEKPLYTPRIERKNKLDILKSLKIDTSSFKIFRSKTPTGTKSESLQSITRHHKTKSDSNLPSLSVNSEFIEVTLDDDNVSAASSDGKVQNGNLLKDNFNFDYSQDDPPYSFVGEVGESLSSTQVASINAICSKFLVPTTNNQHEFILLFCCNKLFLFLCANLTSHVCNLLIAMICITI